MSRTLAALIALMLGFPIAAFVAAGAAVGLNPSIYSDAIGFVSGICFIGAAFIEIHRLATARSEELVQGWMGK
jgi:hypothetical protein